MKVCMGVGPDGNGFAAKNGHSRSAPSPAICSRAIFDANLIYSFLRKTMREYETAAAAGVAIREIPETVWGAIGDLLAEIVSLLHFPESDWLPLAQSLNGAQMAHIADLDDRMYEDIVQAEARMRELADKISTVCPGVRRAT